MSAAPTDDFSVGYMAGMSRAAEIVRVYIGDQWGVADAIESKGPPRIVEPLSEFPEQSTASKIGADRA